MPETKPFAVVLAAGAGSRFGAAKQLEAYRGTPLVTRAVRLAESVCGPRTLLVTGSGWRPVFDACAPLQGFLLRHAGWRSGLGSSIAAATRAVSGSADALLLLLADQPLVTAEHLRALLHAWNGSPHRIAATAFAGVTGPPALFPHSYFPALAALTGDEGARSILASAPSQVHAVPFEPAAIDIDRPEDLANLP